MIALCALTAGLSQPVASAAPGRSATVEPATNLTDEVAKVSWNGFRPTLSDGTFGVDILQCTLHPTSVQRDCNTGDTFPLSLTGNQQTGVTHSDGTGSVFMDVMTSARLPTLACT